MVLMCSSLGYPGLAMMAAMVGFSSSERTSSVLPHSAVHGSGITGDVMVGEQGGGRREVMR